MIINFFKKKKVDDKNNGDYRDSEYYRSLIEEQFSIMCPILSEALIEGILANISSAWCVELIELGADVNYKNKTTSVINAIVEVDNIELLEFLLSTKFCAIMDHKYRSGMKRESNYPLMIDKHDFINKENDNKKTISFIKQHINDRERHESGKALVNKIVNIEMWREYVENSQRWRRIVGVR